MGIAQQLEEALTETSRPSHKGREPRSGDLDLRVSIVVKRPGRGDYTTGAWGRSPAELRKRISKELADVMSTDATVEIVIPSDVDAEATKLGTVFKAGDRDIVVRRA